MSPATQQVFMRQIAPILMAAVPRAVAPVGAEDADELVQGPLPLRCCHGGSPCPCGTISRRAGLRPKEALRRASRQKSHSTLISCRTQWIVLDVL
jgi:hypothetical protein